MSSRLACPVPPRYRRTHNHPREPYLITPFDRLAAALADRYRLERELGAGGMATVYLATDVRHERQVAVKVLRPDLSASIGAERFLQEIRIAARLGHPHILPLHDSGEADGLLYYVMPFVKGESLRERLAREGELPVSDAVRILRDVADALAHAHEHGVVHRDIKPENILLSGRHALVADFGVAKAVSDATGRSQVTTAGVALGTPAYMAPEQAAADPHVDHRADLYALGAVGYEMLAGQPPFTGSSPQQVLASHVTETPRHLSTRRSVVPQSLADAIMRCLEKKPADRWQTAGELLAHVESVTTTPTGGSTPTETRPYAAVSRARRWPLVAGIAAVVLVAAAGGVWGARAFAGESDGGSVVLRDRTQMTFIGRVQTPAISPDGKQLAFVIQECSDTTCTQAVEVQDVGGTASRRVLDGASSAYRLDWSPDRRHLLVTGSVNRQWGTHLVPVLGGEPRRVGVGGAAGDAGATFIAGGDSLIILPPMGADSIQWLAVTDLGGTIGDSIRIETGGSRISAATAVPGTAWIIVGLLRASGLERVVVDRKGRPISRVNGAAGATRVSRDGLWQAEFNDDRRAITRWPLDPETGHLGARDDTVYVGRFTDFSVTDDGAALALDEGAYQHSVFALELADALAGRFDPARRIRHGSTSFGTQLSPDGRRIVLRRFIQGPAGKAGFRASLVPFEGGPDSALTLPAAAEFAYLADSVSLAVRERAREGSRLSLMDLRDGSMRNIATIPDSLLWDWSPLPRGGWIWIADGGQEIRVIEGGKLRTFPKPDEYEVITSVSASKRRVAIRGWNSGRADTMRVGEFSLADGSVTPWLERFVDNGTVEMLADGSIVFTAFESAETVTLYHSPEPGDVRLLGTIPRPIYEWPSYSDDLTRVELGTREYFGDVWISRVERR